MVRRQQVVSLVKRKKAGCFFETRKTGLRETRNSSGGGDGSDLSNNQHVTTLVQNAKTLNVISHCVINASNSEVIQKRILIEGTQ